MVANLDARAHRGAGEWRSLAGRPALQPGQVAPEPADPRRPRDHLRRGGGTGRCARSADQKGVPGVTTLAVSTPDDIDVLVQQLAGSDHVPPDLSSHQGEHLFSSETGRGVAGRGCLLTRPPPRGTSPRSAGHSRPGHRAKAPADPARYPVAVGDLLGTVGTDEVRTPFAGQLVAFIAHPGERVVKGQPVAWLHVPPDGGPAT